ncbi:MAG: SOS response-associated peptidase family protein [Gemmatimonadaceae bacterium]|nr:SOS response-associated peptidase family protein [Gemmatimonadaceae bacterium]
MFADVFFEWRDVGDATAHPRNGEPVTTGHRPVARTAEPAKQPHAILMIVSAPFAFGGLWEAWRDPAVGEDNAPDAWMTSCTLNTTAPNTVVARLYDRMSVIVPQWSRRFPMLRRFRPGRPARPIPPATPPARRPTVRPRLR